MQLLWFLSNLRTPFGDTLFSLLTHFGEQRAVLCIVLAVFWCRDKQAGYYLLTVDFFGSVINQFLKLFCRVPRPWVRDSSFPIVEAAREHASGYSFPSGHTQNVTGTLGGLAVWYRDRRFRVVCLLLILTVAFSRCYLGVHFPTDVLTSLGIGLLLVFLLRPFFPTDEGKKNRLLGVFACGTFLALGKLLHAMFLVPENVDAANLSVAVKNSWSMLGGFLGLLIAYPIERRWIRFEPQTVWWAQLVKLGGGLIIVLLLYQYSGSLLGRLFVHHAAITCGLRYLLLLFFSILLWPSLFRFLPSRTPKSKHTVRK
ncbi:MAG: phosphatase PAP2 family protein [Oscillospiraceae bacterium]|jgi:membrane-associated phospholipid phosphatase